MTTIRCPKCHAGRAHLEALEEHRAGGEHLQTVRCTLCGWRRSRQVTTAPAASAPELPTADRRASPAAVQARASAARAAVEASRVPCRVPGCPGHYFATHSKLGLCEPHRRKLHGWHQTRRLVPPPVACVNGVWIERGAPLPGIPGEQPAPSVVLDETKPPRPKRHRGGAKTVPAAAAPGIESGLYRLARCGNPAARALLVAIES